MMANCLFYHSYVFGFGNILVETTEVGNKTDFSDIVV